MRPMGVNRETFYVYPPASDVTPREITGRGCSMPALRMPDLSRILVHHTKCRRAIRIPSSRVSQPSDIAGQTDSACSGRHMEQQQAARDPACPIGPPTPATTSRNSNPDANPPNRLGDLSFWRLWPVPTCWHGLWYYRPPLNGFTLEKRLVIRVSPQCYGFLVQCLTFGTSSATQTSSDGVSIRYSERRRSQGR